jgi:glycosyltransferase involved in cell wall biosynthesis
VKDFLIKTWRIDPDKIGIVYHGADNRPSGFEEARPGAIPSDCQEGFLFTAGSIRPARGLEDLLRALADLAAAGKRLPLVIAGEADSSSPAYERSMKDLVVNLGICNQVVWTGHLTSKEMAWCYSRASLFIMTSRVEACPNIALEAMSHGSGCIVADNPPLPEFFRDAARYYLPGDSRSLVEAIGAYQASSPEVQKSLRLRAQAYASSFTWDKTAEETVKELMLACESYTR